MNIKGVFQIWMKDGSYHEIDLKECHGWTREGCKSCPDFAAEHADISTGGIGEDNDWTLTIVRTELGEEVIDRMIADGSIIARPAQTDEKAMKLLRLLSIVSRRRWPEFADPAPAVGVPPPKKKAAAPRTGTDAATAPTEATAAGDAHSAGDATLDQRLQAQPRASRSRTGPRIAARMTRPSPRPLLQAGFEFGLELVELARSPRPCAAASPLTRRRRRSARARRWLIASTLASMQYALLVGYSGQRADRDPRRRARRSAPTRSADDAERRRPARRARARGSDDPSGWRSAALGTIVADVAPLPLQFQLLVYPRDRLPRQSRRTRRTPRATSSPRGDGVVRRALPRRRRRRRRRPARVTAARHRRRATDGSARPRHHRRVRPAAGRG